MVGKQQEMPSSEIMLEVFDTPKHALHLQQERGGVLFVRGELPARIPDGVMVAIGVDLRQDGSHSSWVDLIANVGVGGECVLQPSPGIHHDWF